MGIATEDRRHVVLFTGDSSYGVLSYLTTDLARAFIAHGWTTEVVDLTRLSLATELRRIQREDRVRFFCAYSGYGADIIANNQLLYDVLEIPYVGLMLDNPCYFPTRHLTASDQLMLLHGDDGHHDVSVEISPRGSWRGLFRLASTPWADAERPLAARTYGAMFASKGGDPLRYERELRATLDASSRRFVFEVAATLGAQREPQRVWEVARTHAAALGMSTEQPPSVAYHTLVLRADHLARLRRATAVARVLVPLPITFVGGDWSHLQTPTSRATFLPPAPLPAVRRMMADSRVVLNVQPGTTDSMHDRMVLGLHAGAVVVSDSNPVIRERVGHDAFVVWDGNPENIADLVSDSMRASPALQSRAAHGLGMARERLTLTEMAGTLLQTVQLHWTQRAQQPATALHPLARSA